MGTYKKEDYLFEGQGFFEEIMSMMKRVGVNQEKYMDMLSKENKMFKVRVTEKSMAYSKDHKKFTVAGVEKTKWREA